jgi:cytochrome c peroxidase
LDEQLRAALAHHNISALATPEPAPPEQVELGRMLFFEPLLSGNKDTSCASCHDPRFASSDGLSVGIGTGGSGRGPLRRLGPGRSPLSRNTQDLFNRGDPRFREMFSDGNVETEPAIGFGLNFRLEERAPTVLAQQTLIPVLMRREQLGSRGDVAVDGSHNEIADLGFGAPHDTWAAQMQRLLALEAYLELFNAAYPDETDDFSIGHVANAIAAFESSAFVSNDSPFDRYLAGADSALNAEAKRGALLFYGKANCAACHSGNLFTDFKYHCIAAPQVGPGQGSAFGRRGEDVGRQDVSGDEIDRFAFRTPLLRNVELTAPYLHDGCYNSLEDVIHQHLDPTMMLSIYEGRQLDPNIAGQVLRDATSLADMLANRDDLLQSPLRLSEAEVGDLVAFLRALTGDSARDLEHLIPDAVPSGLPLFDQ